MRKFIYVILAIYPHLAWSYSWEQYKSDTFAPLEQAESSQILLNGSLLTLVLVTQRENFVDPLSQKYGEEEKPMGDLAVFGDYMGQLVPNLAYMGHQYWFSDDPQSKRRFTYMLKTSLYTGITTGILKRIFNQRRPHKGDRLSFPSGHTSTAFAFAGVIHYEYDNTLYSSLAFTMATIVGLSRINDHAHYLHDVVFGATLGLAYASAFKSSQDEWVLIPEIAHEKLAINFSRQF
jgi:hypothetical protein